jgi:hypothetical protein
MGKMDMLKVGLGLVSHIEPILKEVVEIKDTPTHGKQELISSNGKYFAIYREIFNSESDAKHFVTFCSQVYAMKKDQLPPIHVLIVMFKLMLPIMTPKELKGKQSHGKPEIKKTSDNKFCAILKEVFTEKEDCINHLKEADEIKSMKL